VLASSSGLLCPRAKKARSIPTCRVREAADPLLFIVFQLNS
jgi:hypothetical protein